MKRNWMLTLCLPLTSMTSPNRIRLYLSPVSTFFMRSCTGVLSNGPFFKLSERGTGCFMESVTKYEAFTQFSFSKTCEKGLNQKHLNLLPSKAGILLFSEMLPLRNCLGLCTGHLHCCCLYCTTTIGKAKDFSLQDCQAVISRKLCIHLNIFILLRQIQPYTEYLH